MRTRPLGIAALTLASLFTFAGTSSADPAPAQDSTFVPAPADTPVKKLRSLRAGPILGVAAPAGLDAGLLVNWKKLVGARADVAMIPTLPVPGVPNAVTSRIAIEAGTRVFPFHGAFFVGGAMGFAETHGRLTASITNNGQPDTMLGTATLKTFYAKPEVGFLWTWKSGLMLGCDVGVDIPVTAWQPRFQATVDGSTKNVAGQGSLASALEFVGAHPMPAVGLIRVGFLL